jgi:protein-L-isoaspartate(D-aspartate) O-methyltransferase
MLRHRAFAAGLLFCAGSLLAQSFEREREAMVRDQIQARGIRNEAVLKAMREIPRHRFVLPGMETLAYVDRALPIGYEQTISQPYIVAFMTQALAPKPSDKVLEIGTGSGYQAAILSRLAAEVYTIEIIEPLARQARERLTSMGFYNIRFRTGDGYKGWPEVAPFDRIMLTAAPPEIPQALIDQLKPGGRMVAPVGARPARQELVVLDKDARGRITRRSVMSVAFVPMVPGK